MLYDVNQVQLFIVLVKDESPIFVESGPFHQDEEFNLQQKCDTLNEDENTSCAYMIARRDYLVTDLEIPDL